MRKADIDTRPARISKTFFDLSKGFVTELTPLGMPGGTTIDESNFEILRDGTRRRRKGLDLETGGVGILLDSVADLDIDTISSIPTSMYSSYRWAAVNNDPTLNFLVTKFGSSLLFWSEGDTLSTALQSDILDLRPYTSFGDTGDTSAIASEPVTMSSMHGRLFVAGKHLESIYVAYSPDTETFTATPLKLLVRDLMGIDDNIGVGTKPSVLTDKHSYNLANRGWNSGTIAHYVSGDLADGGNQDTPRGLYPSKNQIWWKALVRWGSSTYASSFSDMTKLRSFDTSAIENEVFGSTSAPQGHLFLDPYNTTVGTTDGVEDIDDEVKVITDIDIKSRSTPITLSDGSSSTVLRIRLALDNDEGGSVDWVAGEEVTLTGTKLRLKLSAGAPGGGRKTVDVDLSGGKYEIYGPGSGTTDAPTTSSFCVLVPYRGARLYSGDSGAGEILVSVLNHGTVAKGGFYTKTTGYSTSLRPTAVATFAGRVWLAGCTHPELADTIMYSQIGSSTVDGAKAYGKMYQEGDPTAEYLNIVLPTDGGTIQIPGLVGVKALVPIGSSLLVLAASGIWSISGGDSFFSSSNIQVDKLSDVEVVSHQGYAFTDDGMIVASTRGLFKIGSNEQTGRLNSESITLDSIQTYWQNIDPDSFRNMQLVYDNSLYRLYILYRVTSFDSDPNLKSFDAALVYDIRYKSFYKLEFPANPSAFIHGAVAINDVSLSNDNRKLKFFVVTSAGPVSILKVCDMAHTDYVDFDGNELIPFLETGYDGIGESNYRAQEAAQASPDHTTPKYTPYVYVLMKRTETGTDPETEEAINPSSLTMQGRWDFARSAATGKLGTIQQVYRPRYDGTSVPNGYEVVISKNKVRGRGRALSLMFTGEAGYDAHLLGYSIEYTS